MTRRPVLPPLREVAGAVCPMGCGETLVLSTTGTLMCSFSRCPERFTAQRLLCHPEPEAHVVELREGSIRVQHPLFERIGLALFDCDVREKVASFPRLHAPGRYRVFTQQGPEPQDWRWKRIGDASQ